MIPIMWHDGKGKTTEAVRRPEIDRRFDKRRVMIGETQIF